jgi:hypothetical protein
MSPRLAIRRLRLNCLAPRDHPWPDDLRRRIADGVSRHVAEALATALAAAPSSGPLRIRRLALDVTQDAGFEPEALAAQIARQIVQAIRRAQPGEDVIAFASAAACLATLVEALAEGRADRCWWLPEADGVKLLAPAAAIRTVLTADPAEGLEALAGLAPLRLATVLAVLGQREGERVLQALAEAPGVADADACAEAILQLRPEAPAGPVHPALFTFVRIAASRPTLAGAALAQAARWWAEPPDRSDQLGLQAEAGAPAAAAAQEPAARRRLAQARAKRPVRSAANASEEPAAVAAPSWILSRFGGLLLLLPDLDMAAIGEAAGEQAPAIGHAVLGLCAGRARFADWLGEPVWRELFGLDVQAPREAMTARLAEVEPGTWARLGGIGEAPLRQRDARFLLAPATLTGSRPASRALAALARAASARLARRLASGFRDSSAPFLWANLLGAGAAIERRRDGWTARLSRPPLDVLISLSGLADRTVRSPVGVAVKLTRVTP